MTFMKKGTAGTLALYLLPGLAIYTLVSVVPIIEAGYLSFFNGIGLRYKTYIGFQNYREIVSSLEFWSALRNNILYVLFCIVGQVGIGFMLTILLVDKRIRFTGLFRGSMFVPCILAPVVIGFIGLMLYNSRFGLINDAARRLALNFLVQNWLGDPKIVVFALIFLHVWQWIGYYVVIFTAAYQGIPEDVLEASEIEGAVGAKKTRYIIAPLLWDSVKLSIMLCIAGTMKVFDQIFIMTGGGPGKASQVLTIYMYNNTFTNFRMNFGSAISIIILLTSLILIIGSRRLLTRGQDLT